MFKKTIPCSIVLILLWVCPAFSNTVPPTPTQHFYGDADGDTLITTFDLGILVNYFNGQPYTFDTLQPQNPDQDWNTCDIDSDQHCTTFDLGYYTNYFNGQTLGISDKPWVLQNMDLPLTGNTPYTWIPFTVNLYSTLSDLSHSGRPGVSVIAEIAPVGEGSTVTGRLSGRECDPVGGERDQTAQDGSQCALSVTTTDWNTHPDRGLTESGTYGLQVWADGEGEILINLRIEATALEIPAVTISILANFTMNRPPNIRVDCPTHVGETQPTMCGLSVTDPESPPQELTCALSEATVCPGAVLNGCETVSVPEQGEAYGPDYCLVVVDVEDDANPALNAQAYDFIAIDEENRPPDIDIDCPAHVSETEPTSCAITVSDPDLPLQNLTCTVSEATTCTGVTLDGCASADIPAQNEAPAYCLVVVDVQDDFTQPETAQAYDLIALDEVNQAPSIIVDCPPAVIENQQAACDLTATDPDIPAQNLTCYLDPGTTCSGVTMVGCDWALVGEQFDGPSSCTVIVDVWDDFSPLASGMGYDTIDIYIANDPPTITVDCPTSAGETQATSCLLTVSDPDIPPQALTCAISASSQCVGAVVNGCESVDVPAQGEASGPGGCWLGVDVWDDYNPPGMGTGADYITILEENQNPTITVDCPDSARKDRETTCDLVALDADQPPQQLTCSLDASTTCSGVSLIGCYTAIIPPQGVAPLTCSVVVNVQDDFSPPGTGQGSDTINIVEGNDNPIITVDCPGSARKDRETTCDLVALDADQPPQQLTCSLDAITSCSGVSLIGCYTAIIPPQGVAPLTCSVVVNVQDDFSPPGTGQGSDSINIVEGNDNPTVIVDCPTSAGETQATSCSLTAADPDIPPQALICSINPSSTCAGAVVNGCTSVDVPAQGENQGPSVCQLIVDVRDDFSPPGTGQGYEYIMILEENQNPTISVNCPASVNENQATVCPITASDADLPVQSLSCALNAATTCAGVTLTGCTQANVPIQGEAAGPGSCSVVVDVQDDFSPHGTNQGSDSMAINEANQIPVWSLMPTDFALLVNQSYNQNNGHATDADLPNTGSTDPGHLTCSNQSQTCTFPITVIGSGDGAVDCNISLTTGSVSEVCYLTVKAADGWTPAGSITKAMRITVSGPGDADWIGTSVSGAVGGIRPLISRIRNNYPDDFGQVTLNFDQILTSCTATVTCVGGGNVPVTGTVVGGVNCRLDAVAGYWPSNDTCTISNPAGSPACTGPGCFGSDVFKTSLRLSECAPRGGPCGGFIDDGTYGTGDGLQVDLVDLRSGAPVFGARGNHAYALIEHTGQSPVRRIERFDDNDDGMVTVTSGDGLLSESAKITAAYKGDISGMCDNTLAEHPGCYKFVTFTGIDSRRIKMPMERTTSADWQMPEAQIWGYIPIAYFSRFVGARPLSNEIANPSRGAVAILGVLDQNMAGIDLNNLLRATGELSTISMCYNNLGLNIGGLSLPANLLLPDLIRQQWNGACTGYIRASPANTTFRILTNRPNITRKVIVVGMSVNTRLLNVYKSLYLTDLPITMTTMGTATINIPAINQDINMGSIGGGIWGPGTTLPVSVPFEFDFRDSTNGGGSTGKGRRVQLNLANPPYDQERVRMGVAANPDFGDPNRQRAADHQGQFYTLGEQQLMLGVRAGSSGLIPFQLVVAPKIDDGQFTVFQRMNVQSKAFNDQRPWRASSTNTRVVSEQMRGLPGTTVDSDVDWSSAEYGMVGLLSRSNVEFQVVYAYPLALYMPGKTSSATLTDKLENYPAGQVFGGNAWLPLPEVTDPSHRGYYVPPQSDSRGWPINRNGQILRGTAQYPAHAINTQASGARYFTMNNPQTTGAPARYADMYILDLVDSKHIANNYSDTPRGRPDNSLWKIYGEVGGQPSLTVSLPFIMPRRAILAGVNGIVPDPWEAGNMTNQIMEWSLTEHIMDTGARGINAAFDYRKFNLVWTFERTYLSANEAHQFYWK